MEVCTVLDSGVATNNNIYKELLNIIDKDDSISVSYTHLDVYKRQVFLPVHKILYTTCILLALLCFVFFRLNAKIAAILLLLCFTFLGLFNATYQSQPHGSNHIHRFLNSQGFITGIVKNNDYSMEALYQEIIIQAHYFEKDNKYYPAKGKVLLKVFGEGRQFRYGELIRAEVHLKEAEHPKNFGDFNYQEYLVRQQIFVLDNINVEQVMLCLLYTSIT